MLSEWRPSGDQRPPLAQVRHQVEHITDQSSVAAALAYARDDVGVHEATECERPGLNQQTAALRCEGFRQGRNRFALGAPGAVQGVGVLEGHGVAPQTIG